MWVDTDLTHRTWGKNPQAGIMHREGDKRGQTCPLNGNKAALHILSGFCAGAVTGIAVGRQPLGTNRQLSSSWILSRTKLPLYLLTSFGSFHFNCILIQLKMKRLSSPLILVILPS